MIRKDYVFNHTAKTITFTNAVDIKNLGIIVNQADGIQIYNALDPALVGTLVGQVLTLTYDTSSMSDSDSLQIFYAGQDNALLLSKTITAAETSAAFDTTGFQSITIQLSGGWNGNLRIEASNDGTNWVTGFTYADGALALADIIVGNGIYSFKCAGTYMRYICPHIGGSALITIVGNAVDSGLAPADLIAFAMDKNNNMPLQVQLPQNLKQDLQGALIGSDAALQYIFNSADASRILIIDTQGYNSIILHETTAGIITPSHSNDGANWYGLTGFLSSAPTVALAATAGAGVHVFPVLGRYLKLTGPASFVNAVVYLRQAPFFMPVNNMSQFGGYNVVTAGVNGMMAVGGNVAAGSTPTASPVLVAGVDGAATPLTRRLLTDAAGRIQAAAVVLDGLGVQKQVGGFGPTIYGGEAMQVIDIDYNDRTMDSIDVLSAILLELKILNQQFYEFQYNNSRGAMPDRSPDDIRNAATSQVDLT